MPSNSTLVDPVDLMVTTAGTYLTIGTSPDHGERPVNWKITDHQGRPHRGLVVGAYQDPDRRLAAYLPGYTAPARSATRPDRRQACGRGVYGRDGIARRVTVHHP